MIAVDAGGWTVRNVQIEIRKGAKPGWFQMRVAGKKFIVREVPSFFEQGEKAGGKSTSKRESK
jgi:hypothetical protein